MRLLLDTSILLWVTNGSSRLTPGARKLIEDAELVFVSAISLWEVAIKVAAGRFDVDFARLVDQVEEAGS